MGRAALRGEGTTPVRFFVLTKEAREGKTGDYFSGRKEIIFSPGTMPFSLTNPIHFFPK